jgi:UrcA family protein
MNTKLSLIPALTACLFALSLPIAHAAQSPASDDAVSQIVRFGDLDLSTPAGQKTLHGRLRAASWQVCLEAVPLLPGLYIQNAKCRQAVLADALTKVFGKGGKAEQLAARGEDRAVVAAARRAP